MLFCLYARCRCESALAAALFAALLECGLLSIFDALLATVLLVVFEWAIDHEIS
jgi:hypothetical protein